MAYLIICPRCHRSVSDTDEGRKAHGISCVKIPKYRAKSWGVKNVQR